MSVMSSLRKLLKHLLRSAAKPQTPPAELNKGLDCEDVLQGLFLGHEPVGGVAEEVADGFRDGFGPNGRPRPVHEAVHRDGPVAVRLLRVCCLCHRCDGALEDLSWPG